MSASNGNRRGRLIRSDVFHIFIGLVLAVVLLQADRTISAANAAGAPSHAIISRDTMTVGTEMIHLGCVRLVAAVNSVLSVAKSRARFCEI